MSLYVNTKVETVPMGGDKVVITIVVDSFFFSSRRRHTRLQGDWSSDVCSSDLDDEREVDVGGREAAHRSLLDRLARRAEQRPQVEVDPPDATGEVPRGRHRRIDLADRKSVV